MGSRGGEIEEPKLQSLARQGSIYSLTLDDVQNQVVGLRKPLGSMNLDEFLKTVWTVQDNGTGVGWNQALSRQGSVTLSKDLSKKTVDEVWREVQEKKKSGNVNQEQTLGEMTLEDLLVEVGVVGESVPQGNDGECDSVVVPNQQHCNQWMQFQPLPNQQNMVSVYMPSHSVPQPLAMLDAAAYPGNQMSVSVSDTQVLGRKRVAPGDDLEEEKTIERRQKRMIKNRESAARSRARKQAYTHELEIKVSRLEEENERLRRQKDIEKVLPVRPPEPKNQLRRTSSASF